MENPSNTKLTNFIVLLSVLSDVLIPALFDFTTNSSLILHLNITRSVQ